MSHFSGHGKTLEFVYGRVSARVSYKFPTATGLHSAFIQNCSGSGHVPPHYQQAIKDVRYYFETESKISGPLSDGFTRVKKKNFDGFIDSYYINGPNDRPGYWWVDDYHHNFNLRGELTKHRYTLTVDSKLTAKYDIDGDGDREEETWPTSISLRFRHKR